MIRLAIVAVCFVALSGAIVGRMVYVNINDRDFLQNKAISEPSGLNGSMPIEA